MDVLRNLRGLLNHVEDDYEKIIVQSKIIQLLRFTNQPSHEEFKALKIIMESLEVEEEDSYEACWYGVGLCVQGLPKGVEYLFDAIEMDSSDPVIVKEYQEALHQFLPGYYPFSEDKEDQLKLDLADAMFFKLIPPEPNFMEVTVLEICSKEVTEFNEASIAILAKHVELNANENPQSKLDALVKIRQWLALPGENTPIRAMAMQAVGNNEEAELMLNEIINLNPHSTFAKGELVRFYLKKAFFNLILRDGQWIFEALERAFAISQDRNLLLYCYDILNKIDLLNYYYNDPRYLTLAFQAPWTMIGNKPIQSYFLEKCFRSGQLDECLQLYKDYLNYHEVEMTPHQCFEFVLLLLRQRAWEQASQIIKHIKLDEWGPYEKIILVCLKMEALMQAGEPYETVNALFEENHENVLNIQDEFPIVYFFSQALEMKNHYGKEGEAIRQRLMALKASQRHPLLQLRILKALGFRDEAIQYIASLSDGTKAVCKIEIEKIEQL